jgi:hypothetical protein
MVRHERVKKKGTRRNWTERGEDRGNHRTGEERNQRKNWRKGAEPTKRDRTGENFGPSTSSKSSCFYHHCLRLERRRLGKDTNKEGELEKTETERRRDWERKKLGERVNRQKKERRKRNREQREEHRRP